ncbi:MAG: carboxymuconolactone decarboxylase family protein [Pseudomonadota bacterium]
MVDFTIHAKSDADGERKETLEAVEKKYGFVPNLLGGLAEAPSAARAYIALGEEVGKSSFTPTERHVAWFAVNYYNNCHYCMPAHTAIAKSEKIADDVIEAARHGGGYADVRLQALHDFLTALVDQHGAVSDETVQKFIDAGFTRQNVLEAVVVVAHKTISNFANHLMNTPVDAAFAGFAWEKDKAA